MIAVLTPTGDRPDAFAACVEGMRGQSYDGDVLWVIADDGREPMPTPDIAQWEVRHLRPVPLWKPGENTQARNLLAGLDVIEHAGIDRVVIAEDDDAYAHWWIETCNARLEDDDLVGEAPSLYRHLSGRETLMGNERHASLCSTALKGPARDVLRDVCEEGGTAIDMRLWRRFEGRKRLYAPQPRGVTGIKGWPGRPGIGVGHRMA